MELKPSEGRELVQINPVVVLTTINKEGKTDAMAAAWISSLSLSPPLIMVSVKPSRYSHKNLTKEKEFVVNVPSRSELEKVWYVGTRSFRDEPDKIKNSGFSLAESEQIKPPRIQESVGWLECKVKKMILTGDHSVVVGQIVASEVKDKYWDSTRGFLAEKAGLFHHLRGRKFLETGKVIEH